MAFDRSQFDRGQFDSSSGEKVRWLNVDFSERVDKAFVTALNYFLECNLYTRVDKGTMYGIPVRFMRPVTFLEEVDEEVTEAAMYALLHAAFSEDIGKRLIHSANIRHPSLTFNEEISKSAQIGCDYYQTTAMSEAISANAIQSANVRMTAENYELVSASASSEAIEYKTCFLDITLKPGQRLIIDANNYNVLLNGENAIYIQRGDWIDAINRNTTSIDIDSQSGRGNISASIMYTERFL